MEELKGIEPREYQQKIFETAQKHNTLVVLPTGMGKTLIALMLSVARIKQFPQLKVLFLAPTRPLVAQHHSYFHKHLPDLFAEMTLFTGKINSEKRKELWTQSNIVFSTPQCIANDLRHNRISLAGVSLLIEDECHRCLKNYDYTYVVQKFMEQSQNARILGMTASPGADAQVINEICKNLGIEAVEIRHRYSEDVKGYIQNLETRIVKVELPQEIKKARDLLNEIYKKKLEELKNRNLLHGPLTKKALILLQAKLHSQIATGNKHFNVLKGVSVCAQALKLSHAIELIETQNVETSFKYLQDLIEQARQGKSKAAVFLIKNTNFQKANIELMQLLNAKFEHPKMSKLKEAVAEELEKNKEAKIIVFNQYRDSIAKICRELNALSNEKGIDVRAKVFVGQAIKGETGMNQKEQQSILNEFKLGEINVLCATSIGEEGLDIPEVNAVIFYEPIPSAIRKIQRAGRTARLMPGKVIILMTEKTRDETHYWAAFHKERRMYGILDGMQKSFSKKIEEKKQKKLGEF